MIFSTNPSLCPCRVGIVDRFAVVINQTVSAYFPVVVVFYRAAEQQTSSNGRGRCRRCFVMGYIAVVTYDGSFFHFVSIIGIRLRLFVLNNDGQALDDTCPCCRVRAAVICSADDKPTAGICSCSILLTLTLHFTVFVICLLSKLPCLMYLNAKTGICGGIQAAVCRIFP